MIAQTVIMQFNLPETFLTYLQNRFKNSHTGIFSIGVEETTTHTAITLIGDNINGICQAIYELGQADGTMQNILDQKAKELKKNDYVKYLGGSTSAYLTAGKKYRLTGTLHRSQIFVINDKGKRMQTQKRFFDLFPETSN